MPNTWIIEESPDKKVDILVNRRAFAYDLSDEQTALKRIMKSKKWKEGDAVVCIDADGYRRRLKR